MIKRNTENLSGTTEPFFKVPAGLQTQILDETPDKLPDPGFVYVYVKDETIYSLDEFGNEVAISGGGIGPPGPPGEEAFHIIEYDFTYQSDASMLLTTVKEGIRIKKVAIEVLVPFNDANARLSVGHTGNIDGLMARADNDPQSAALYEVEPNFEYGGADVVVFYLTSAGSTQGSGTVFVEYIQN